MKKIFSFQSAFQNSVCKWVTFLYVKSQFISPKDKYHLKTVEIFIGWVCLFYNSNFIKSTQNDIKFNILIKKKKNKYAQLRIWIQVKLLLYFLKEEKNNRTMITYYKKYLK